MPTSAVRPLLLTTGDPDGIGPDLIAYLDKQSHRHPLLVIGETEHIPLSLPQVSMDDLHSKRPLPQIALLQHRFDGLFPASYAYLDLALDLLDQNLGAALVTGPIDKKKWLDAGIPYKGHTELFQSRYNPAAMMFFWSDTLKVALYTIHCPLSTLAGQMSIENICSFLDRLIPALAPLFDRPCRIVLAGFNPHAGEGGIMGQEEERFIKPAMAILKTRHANEIVGPYPADSLFYEIRGQRETVVVCWYHDQGLIPFKILHFHDGVNVTLGLPFLRTSPDHGTAAALKGTDRIEPGSMLAAVHLADDWADRARASGH